MRCRDMLADGDATFSIHQREDMPTGYGVTVYFEIGNLDEKVKNLISRSILTEVMPVD